MSFEQPVLWLGLAGFTPAQHERLNLLLSQMPKGWPTTWRVATFGEADAWLVSGQKSRLLSADTLKILAGQPTERAMQLNLEEVDRPIAFSLPLVSSDLDPMYTFDPASGVSLYKVLQQFEVRLQHLCAQFVLGGQLIARESQLLPGIYHVNYKGALLAVMDFHEWRIGISPSAEPTDFESARWDKRPLEANDIPGHFLRSSLTQVRWIYAQRAERDVLPARYRSKPVYFRRAPGVPLRWLRDSQLLLLRELSVAPGNFDALQRRSGLTPTQLARDMASLYFAGSVTTTAGNAGAGIASHEGSSTGPDSTRSDEGADPGAEPVSARRPHSSPMDLTAPVQLGLK
jgi:hypothetical protein